MLAAATPRVVSNGNHQRLSPRDQNVSSCVRWEPPGRGGNVRNPLSEREYPPVPFRPQIGHKLTMIRMNYSFKYSLISCHTIGQILPPHPNTNPSKINVLLGFLLSAKTTPEHSLATI